LLHDLFGADDRTVASNFQLLAGGVFKVLETQPILSEVRVPCKVFGDLHGQARDMLLFFRSFGFPGAADDVSFVFNGDFVDRGRHQLEVVGIIFALKLVFPQLVWFNRGNHEDSIMSEKYDFLTQCSALGPEDGQRTYDAIQKVFNHMPLAALVGSRIFVVHGGIGAGDWSLDDLRRVKRPLSPSMLRSPEMSWVWQCLWSDPIEEDKNDSNVIGVHPSPARGNRTTTFGWDVTARFCAQNELDLIVRSHQFKKCGFGFDVMHDDTLIRVFSARDYVFKTGRPHASNDATILHVSRCDVADEDGSAGGTLSVRAQVLPSTTETRGPPVFDEYTGRGQLECGTCVR